MTDPQKKTETIAERLRIARGKMGLNRSEAADYLGLSKMGYYRYESGARTPSFQTLTYIAQKFNTSVDYLIGKTDLDQAEQIIVDKNLDPELHALVEFYQKTDNRNKDRLITYWKRLVAPTASSD